MYHFGRKFKEITRFGRKIATNITHFGRKIAEHTPRISHEIASYGDAIGHERLAKFGRDLNGPLVSHEMARKLATKGFDAQTRILNHGFATADHYGSKAANSLGFSY